MPRAVDKVPNPWEPFMDGRIWEFTQEEIQGMPGWMPMINQTREGYGEPIGMNMMQWVVKKGWDDKHATYYVVFYDATHPIDINTMAGWKVRCGEETQAE